VLALRFDTVFLCAKFYDSRFCHSRDTIRGTGTYSVPAMTGTSAAPAT